MNLSHYFTQMSFYFKRLYWLVISHISDYGSHTHLAKKWCNWPPQEDYCAFVLHDSFKSCIMCDMYNGEIFMVFGCPEKKRF
jgi:ubiquinone/menaquinone biosynthesis C-methylase UbiE